MVWKLGPEDRAISTHAGNPAPIHACVVCHKMGCTCMVGLFQTWTADIHRSSMFLYKLEVRRMCMDALP